MTASLFALATARDAGATPGVASVAGSSPESEARELFARGRERRVANDCARAVPLFREASTIYPQGLGSLRNLAECEEQLGHFVAAREAWRELKRAVTASPHERYEGWEDDADEAARRLGQRIATFVVDVYVKSADGERPAAAQPGLVVTIDGEPIASSSFGVPLERDPGTYRVVAQLAGAPRVEQLLSLEPGDNPRVTIHIERPAPAPPPRTRREEASTQRTVGWVAAGAGAAALLGAGVTLLVRQGAVGEVEAQCPSRNGCRASLRDTVETGKTMSLLASLLLPIGVVGVGGGALLVVTSGPSVEPRRSTGWVRLTPALGGLGLSGRF